MSQSLSATCRVPAPVQAAPWPRHRPHPLARAIQVVRTGCAFEGADVLATAADRVIVRTLGGQLFAMVIEPIGDPTADGADGEPTAALGAHEDPTPSDQFPALHLHRGDDGRHPDLDELDAIVGGSRRYAVAPIA